MLGPGLSLTTIAIRGSGPPVPVLRPVALINPTSGAAWVTPDGKMFVIMQEVV